MEVAKVAFSCKTLKLAKPIRGMAIAYAGMPPVHPDALDEARREGFAAGEAKAAEQNNAQVLEYREELQALHDEVLGAVDKRFQELCSGVSEVLPTLVMEVLRKVLPTLDLPVEAITSHIEQLVEAHGGEDRVLKVQVGERDFELLAKLSEEPKAGNELTYGGIQIERDMSLGPGDCILKTTYGLIDATVGTRIKHIGLALEGA